MGVRRVMLHMLLENGEMSDKGNKGYQVKVAWKKLREKMT